MWIFYGLFSAVFLGFYDAVRKKVLNQNPVIPVLFLSSATNSLIFLPIVVLSGKKIIQSEAFLFIPQGNIHMHILAFYKSILVGSSWFLAYNALRKLPLTIVVPIRSTSPMWTLIAAMIIYDERFTLLQWLGIITVLGFFYYFSLAGKREGIHFFSNKWIYAAIGATLLGTASNLYDKYLFTSYDRLFMQAWHYFYMTLVLLPLVIYWWKSNQNAESGFSWSFFIPLIGLLLVFSDFLFFYALSGEGSLIALLAMIRRSSVVISFISGAVFFGERNLKRKGIALTGIFGGVVMIIIGTILDTHL